MKERGENLTREASQIDSLSSEDIATTNTVNSVSQILYHNSVSLTMKEDSNKITRDRGNDLEDGGALSFTPPRENNKKSNHFADSLSPAPTYTTCDESLSSPTRTFDEMDPSPTKITIDHNVKTSGGGGSGARSAGLMLGMTKPVLAIVAALFLTTSGAAAYFLNGWLKIPGLESQIERLNVQVERLNTEIDRLSGEIDRLEVENDRYESLNNYLNSTVVRFQELNEDLNKTTIRLEDVADDLNATNQELLEKIKDLAEENDEYAQLNVELNVTTAQLANQVTIFQSALAKIVLENEILANTTDYLETLTDYLGNITEDQDATLVELQEALVNFQSENSRLGELNMDLVTIVGFLNDASNGLNNSLQQITTLLAGQITANRALVLASLENTFRQRIANWDCDYRDIFRGETFGNNFTVPIADVDTVVAYVDERVLSELCLDAIDFEMYLSVLYPSGLNSFQLIRSVLIYTMGALDFYFPESNELGLTAQEWEDASFSCNSLGRSFLWDNVAN
jgi:predicted  nucleic acid-binding Zn-ribbon protein